MRKIINEQTGKEEVVFSAEVISVGTTILSNVNGTEYRIANIKFKDIKGNTQKSTAVIYENNFKYGVEVGNSYRCTATPTEQGVFLKLSHLPYVDERAEASAFGLEAVKSVSKVSNNADALEA